MNGYFPHDSNARNSDKVIPLRAKYGAEGYGVYFMILERLRDEPDYMSVKDYNMLAFDLRVSSGLVKSVIEEFGLFSFTENGERFYSESFLKRMSIKDEKSEKAKESAKKRWESDKKCERIQKPMRTHTKTDANAMRTHTKTDASKLKESKQKERKVKDKESGVVGEPQKQKFLSNVFLTAEEHQKLIRDHDEDFVQRGIEKLDNYIEKLISEGKSDPYTNHNLVIRGWIKKRVNEDLIVETNLKIAEKNLQIVVGKAKHYESKEFENKLIPITKDNEALSIDEMIQQINSRDG